MIIDRLDHSIQKRKKKLEDEIEYYEKAIKHTQEQIMEDKYTVTFVTTHKTTTARHCLTKEQVFRDLNNIFKVTMLKEITITKEKEYCPDQKTEKKTMI
jgi:hypothetical protein